MTHYVCNGDCQVVKEEPGVCQADFCNKKGEDLEICGCEDEGHTAKIGSEKESEAM